MQTKLGIRFADNDFTFTVRGFLRIIHDGVMHNLRGVLAENLTKAQVVELFNALAPTMYQLYQKGCSSPTRQNVVDWLRVEEKNIFLDDEVDVYVEKIRTGEEFGNGEFHYYDYQGTMQAEMTGQKLEPVIMTV